MLRKVRLLLLQACRQLWKYGIIVPQGSIIYSYGSRRCHKYRFNFLMWCVSFYRKRVINGCFLRFSCFEKENGESKKEKGKKKSLKVKTININITKKKKKRVRLCNFIKTISTLEQHIIKLDLNQTSKYFFFDNLLFIFKILLFQVLRFI